MSYNEVGGKKMKKVLSLLLVLVLVGAGLFVLTGCDKDGGKKADNTVQISKVLGKGTVTLSVPKNDDGTAKYEFTTTKPEGLSVSGTFYLVTDTAMFAFSTSGLAYNTSKDYKAKYGETEATFDGYLAFMDDTTISSRPKLAGIERFELNGRKALRYYNRTGSSNDYKYYGYFYMVAVDEIYPGSKFNMTVNYKTEEKPTEVKEFDEETLAIISSLKITLNQQ